MSVNKVILVGRLGKDPETRYMTNGEAVTNVNLATEENWKDKTGEKQSKTEWHKIVFYRRLAEVAGEYLKKGGLIYIEGKLQTRKWQDKETGKDHYTTEIIAQDMKMLVNKQEHETEPNVPASKSATGKFDDNFDSDIPFMEPCRHYGLWRVM